MQSVLDAAVVDRFDFVEIFCSDAPCLTEATQQRGISLFSLLRSDGVGNHDAQIREKLHGWFSEKRTSEGLVLTTGHCAPEQFDTLQSSSYTDFSTVFSGMLQQYCNLVATCIRERPAKCAGWSSVELREFRAQQKSCGRELFMTVVCDSCFFAK